MNNLSWRKDFPLLQQKRQGKNLVYLDNSATTQKPFSVLQAMNEFYERDNANVHRGIYDLSLKATMVYEQAHQTAADFIGAQFEEIVFTKGTTDGLNLLAYTLTKKLLPGDEIVLTMMEHHSNLVPWQEMAREKKLALKFIPLTNNYLLDLEKAKKIITPRTKIVAVTHMSNVLGTINPVKQIADLAHKAGAMVIVDAAQSVAHLPLKVKELDCDFLVFSGHKMSGPMGIGVLYGRKELLEKMDPFLYGGDMINEVTLEKATWNELPWKFEAGTPHVAGAIGLAAAIGYIQKIGWKKIMAQEKILMTYALKQLAQIPGLKIIGPASIENRGAVISFVMDGIHPHDATEILNRDNIAVRAGQHCAMPLLKSLGLNGTIRASFYFYNTLEEVDALVRGLRKVREVFRP